MNAWGNIEVSSNNPEILAIDRIEQTLGNVPKQVYKIRELITRFEACHFKYEKHYQHIIESIAALKPTVDVNSIGSYHPRHGEKVIDSDPTGHSQASQKYISALCFWLDNTSVTIDKSQKGMNQQVAVWLDEKNDAKKRLVSMLLDRLLYRSLEKYMCGSELKGLEYQIIATDICNYSFPQNIEKIIQGIGKLEAVKDFHGCGTTNSEIKSSISKKFKKLCTWLKEDMPNADSKLGEKDSIKVWLVACLAKTIKEQIQLLDPIPDLTL
jgi:hypothetical protein